MLEAFQKARQQNPDSLVAQAIKDVGKERKKERKRNNLDVLASRFEDLGKEWMDLLIKKSYLPLGQVSISEDSIKEKWRVLQGALVKIHNDQRARMIGSLANGMGFPEESATSGFYKMLADLSGYSEEQKDSFNNFMAQRKDLRGSVKLSQAYPAVADWFVMQNQQKQK